MRDAAHVTEGQGHRIVGVETDSLGWARGCSKKQRLASGAGVGYVIISGYPHSPCRGWPWRATAAIIGRARICGPEHPRSTRSRGPPPAPDRPSIGPARPRPIRSHRRRPATAARAPAPHTPAHVRCIPAPLLLHRPRHRPRHRQHADLRARQGHRARRALGRRHPPRRRPARQEDHPGRRQGSQGHAGQGARQHRGHPADEGRRDRRLHRHRADAQAVHQDGPPAVRPAPEPAHHHLRALRQHPGRAPRHPRKRRSAPAPPTST